MLRIKNLEAGFHMCVICHNNTVHEKLYVMYSLVFCCFPVNIESEKNAAYGLFTPGVSISSTYL